ncbi:MAG: UNC-like C-terminal-domain-containing protein [Benniella sp.]|nr:MAG: UNC-like C-terminal-domain-containing protein [Benniella sp.]
MDVVDEVLERHSADVVAKPDYALSSAGGSIIPHLTFLDFAVQMKPRFLGRLGLKHLIPANPQVEKRAIKAIQPDVHAGSCWAMQGDHGQIGIQLARAIIVTEVTIEHVDPRITLHYGSAPREMEIWGLASSQKATLLTTIEYKYAEHECKQPKLVQSFQIPLQKQNVVSTGVVVRVNSNWGYPAFTCLYRIRVHGFESTLGGL